MYSDPTTKAIIYTCPSSLWASVPALGLIEKGYTEAEYNLKSVNLFKGENYCPAFLRLNPKGTVPVLVVPVLNEEPDHPQKYRSITESAQILEFLDISRKAQVNQSISNGNNNPAPALSPAIISVKLESDRLIQMVHSDSHDLNFLMLGCLNERELDQKADSEGVVMAYLKGQSEALSKYLSAQSEEVTKATTAFWNDRRKTNELDLSVYTGQASKDTKDAFFLKTKAIWIQSVDSLIELEKVITSHGGKFILGEQLSLVDIHIGAWLARLFTLLGIKTISQELDLRSRVHGLTLSLQNAGLQMKIDKNPQSMKKIEEYWQRLSKRASFQKVYGDGLH